MEEMSQGKLEGNLDLKENEDEVGQTVKSINTMSVGTLQIIADMDYLLKEMAAGNFDITTNCEEKYIGDYKNLIVSVRKINRELSSILSDINVSAEQVDSGSEQVASASQALSQGATQQAASEELSAQSGTLKELVGKFTFRNEQ